jgi:hypothetical protein
MGLGVSMSDLRKAAQQALDNAELMHDEHVVRYYDDINDEQVVLRRTDIDTLRAALAQPEQQLTLTFDAFVKQIRDKAIYETIYADTEGRDILVITLLDAYVLMRHIAPPQRKPLTDEALMALLPGAVRLPPGWKDFARSIERAHGIGGEV